MPGLPRSNSPINCRFTPRLAASLNWVVPVSFRRVEMAGPKVGCRLAESGDSSGCWYLVQHGSWDRGPASMAKFLTMDLRDRAMARLDTGETVCEVAVAPSVAPSCVVKSSQHKRAMGSTAPGKIGGHVPRKIRCEPRVWLRARMAEATFILRGLVAAKAGPCMTPGVRAHGLNCVNCRATAAARQRLVTQPGSAAPWFPAARYKAKVLLCFPAATAG